MPSLLSHPVLPYVIGGGLAVATLYVVAKVVIHKRHMPRRHPNCVYPRDTVILHQYGRGPYAPSPSPFPIKLETYLRMAKIPYQTDHDQGFSRTTQKSPWMTYNDMEMGDSQLCIEYLNKTLGVDVNSYLSDEQKATARAFEKMVDENTYWCFVLERWSFSIDYDFLKMAIAGLTTWRITLVSKRLLQQAHGQGMGRHTKMEVYQIATGDLQALSTFLGTKAFMFGDKPSEVDCSVFGHLAQIHWQFNSASIKEIFGKFPNLAAYCERMKTTFWPDWEDCITHGGTRQATK